uniref:D5-like helicase-primase n=1 Tax=Pithovirus LCPAC403 TaxID=2506596 RepID=A0A481ZB16_9VIRU|nr:MAG: D5-like helicase-primase [Pithovirus LCPAC403]
MEPEIDSWRNYFILSDKKTHCLGTDDSYVLLPEKKREKFWFEYLQRQNRTLAIKEIFDDTVPLITDFEFIFAGQNHKEAYGDTFKEKLVTIHQNIIIKHFDFSTNLPQRLFGCTFEEDIEKLDSKISKLKIHFHFPYVKLPRDLVSKFFIPLLVKTLNVDEDILNSMNKKPCEPWSKIITSKYNPLALYGSSTRILTGCYIREDDKCASVPKVNLMNYIKVRYHSDIINENVSLHKLKDLSLEGIFFLPFILSSNFEPPSEITPIENEEIIEDDTNYFPDKLEMAKAFMKMLSPHRATNFAFWISIGKCLHSITNGTVIGLSLWKQFTHKHSKEGDQKNDREEKYYNTFCRNPLTEKTLGWYASKDNPKMYHRWKKRWIESELSRSLSDGEIRQTYIAKLFYKCYWMKYICSSYKHKDWYTFKNGTWCRTDGYVAMKNEIDGNFSDIFRKKRDYLKHQTKDIDVNQDKEFIDRVNFRITIIEKLLDSHHLGSPGWINSIITQSAIYFHKDDVENLMNDNVNLTGLANGIIETYENGAFFREGTPEDYVSKKINISWIDLTLDSGLVIKLINYLEQVFPDRELRMYVRKIAAGWLKSGNPYKKFIIFTGDTDASKSIYKKLIETAYGLDVYVFNIPITMFTQKRKSGPSPAMSQGQCAKLLICQEPDSDDVMKGGMIKEISGGDSLFTRKLYSNGGSIKATYQVIEVCNNPPKMDDVDPAIEQRMCFIPFISLFKRKGRILTEEEIKKYGDNIFEVNPFFDAEIPSLARAFIWLCVHDYPRYIEEGLEIQPKIAKDYTEKYWESTNVYNLFISENVEQKLPDYETLSVNTIYMDFTRWFRQCYPHTARVSREKFMKNISEKIGNPSEGIWTGMKSRNINSEFQR